MKKRFEDVGLSSVLFFQNGFSINLVSVPSKRLPSTICEDTNGGDNFIFGLGDLGNSKVKLV